jgi:hypothetical protein
MYLYLPIPCLCMASKKEGVTATLGTFEIPLKLKIDYKVACMESGVTMTDELKSHIEAYVKAHQKEKAAANVAP